MNRILDIIFALVAGLLMLPIMLLVATTVIVLLGRPAIFVQTRAGEGERPFRMIKFRSMSDKRDSNGKLLSDEERTTAFGRLLRRSRLDELPEFWNILVGDMSLIGPRPILPETIRALGERGALRCSVKPGLTGWAQISGNAVLTDNDKIDLDLWYIRNRTFWIDLQILVMTVFVMIFGERLSESRLSAAKRKDIG
ncbi:sugar transferase [Pararhizobium sp. YC-54]|uniref:sugar transferase n=1 Tax=Pararhizobium sp. YC-54 TaxID=2986920 RepID=UPI0021F6D8E3|nr:sugar transferase [Pararhizobium sp. YC-54]MCV9999551.1 sugar transferase [Pararhizobium sp. YC-54]